MWRRLLPAQFDNHYGGARVALWLLVPIVFVNLVMGFNVLLNTYHVAVTADNTPLATYPAAAAGIIVRSFKSWALGRLLLTSLGVLALLRYRTMVPLVYLVMLIDSAGLITLSMPNPIDTLTKLAPVGALIHLALFGALLLGFALSMTGRSSADGAAMPGVVEDSH